ncbi:heparan sulfate glucosamine 3-O-sulfotransferase 6-like [Pecten maximus]|uniref:heparan sulfate glucosamine 3-O-sulfotransferase 6-like n=1 Tax=Pecten maximus TaxID=6579 RepID=UPI0014585327|nr:heparan sulfate glucosamine 3-O-sulfotransferase 6-like [Pecten maximus]
MTDMKKIRFWWIFRRGKKKYLVPSTVCVCGVSTIVFVAILNVFSAVTRSYNGPPHSSVNTTRFVTSVRKMTGPHVRPTQIKRETSNVILDIDEGPEAAYMIHDFSDTDRNAPSGHIPESDTFYVDDYDKIDENAQKPHERSKLQKISKVAAKRLPKALIIGVRRCGTRALLTFLRVHPDIRAPGPEVHFFDKHYHKGLEWYRKQMPTTLSSQLTIEKTPSYYVIKGVPEKVHRMAKHIKLIVVVRDPVSRALSDYVQLASKHSDIGTFEELAFLNNATGLVDTSWSVLCNGVYSKSLVRWLQYFSLNQFHFVSGERLVDDPAGEIAKVQDFLGLKRIITSKHLYYNRTRGFPCVKKHERHGKPRCVGVNGSKHYPTVTPRLVKRLRDFYKPFNKRFYEITGVDFGWDDHK